MCKLLLFTPVGLSLVTQDCIFLIPVVKVKCKGKRKPGYLDSDNTAYC